MIDNSIKGHVYRTKKGKLVEATGKIKQNGDDQYVECGLIDDPNKREFYRKSELRPDFVKRYRTPMAEALAVYRVGNP